MAFFRNFSDGAVEQIGLSERSHSHQPTMNNSRLNENDMCNNEEMVEPTHGHNAGEDSNNNIRLENTQHSLRETTSGGKWGSTFWKDSQTAMTSRGASESGEESNSGSEYKGSEVEEDSDGVEDTMEPENHDKTYKKVSGKRQQHVPADEMLSDEYYEQDGDDQGEPLNHYRTKNHPSGYSSKPPPRSAAPSSISRKSKALKSNKFSDEDGDFEEDDDGEDEDDPDDADFDPDYGATTGHRAIKVVLRLSAVVNE